MEKFSESELFRLTSKKMENRFWRSISSSRFKSLMYINEKTCVTNSLRKTYAHIYPRQLGCSILYESKLRMLKSVYSLKAFAESEGMELFSGYSDTDSYLYGIKNVDMNKYPTPASFRKAFNEKCYYLFDELEQNELGLATYEVGDDTEIVEVCSICPKTYSLKMVNRETGEVKYKLRAKGVSRSIAEEKLNHELYKSVVTGDIFMEEESPELTAAVKMIKSSKLSIKTIEAKKKVLPYLDLKSKSYKTTSGKYVYKIFGEN